MVKEMEDTGGEEERNGFMTQLLDLFEFLWKVENTIEGSGPTIELFLTVKPENREERVVFVSEGVGDLGALVLGRDVEGIDWTYAVLDGEKTLSDIARCIQQTRGMDEQETASAMNQEVKRWYGIFKVHGEPRSDIKKMIQTEC
jgi:hypothetical protein